MTADGPRRAHNRRSAQQPGRGRRAGSPDPERRTSSLGRPRPRPAGASARDGIREPRRLPLGAEFLIGVEIESAHPESDQTIDLTLTSATRLRGRSGVIATGVAYRQLNAPAAQPFVGRAVHYGSATDAAPTYPEGT